MLLPVIPKISLCGTSPLPRGMQVEEVGRRIVGLEHRQIIRVQMRIALLAGEDSEKKRQVRAVGVQQIQRAQLLRIIAGHGGKVCIELVVRFGKEVPVRISKHAGELAHELVEFALWTHRTSQW